jgi:flagellar basal body rod protein FlgG
MNIGLYQSAASLSALERWQDAVSQNITSSQVSGFRKRTVAFSTVEMGQVQADPKARGADGTKAAMFPTTSLGVSFLPGETTPTRRELDVAIQGDGFLEVQMPGGVRGYTRAGELHLDSSRTLVSRDNLPVLSQSGTPIVLQAEGGSLSIAQDGAISQGDTQLGKLSVVKFPDNSQLLPVGGGTFLSKDGTTPAQVEQPAVLQGYLEASNVTPLREMISLVQIARAYEANQKIMTDRDQNLQKAIETLG